MKRQVAKIFSFFRSPISALDVSKAEVRGVSKP